MDEKTKAAIQSGKKILTSLSSITANSAKLTGKKLANYVAAQNELAATKKAQAAEALRKAESERTATTLRNAVAYAITQIPESMVFYDFISKYALTVNTDTDGFYVTLPISKPDKTLRHFHTFDSKLQTIFDALHEQALVTLKNRILEDVILWKSQQLELDHTGVFRGVTDAQFLNEYTHLYTQWTIYLYRITSIHSVPTDAGVKVHFQAVFDDSGLSPQNYYCNCRLIM